MIEAFVEQEAADLRVALPHCAPTLCPSRSPVPTQSNESSWTLKSGNEEDRSHEDKVNFESGRFCL